MKKEYLKFILLALINPIIHMFFFHLVTYFSNVKICHREMSIILALHSNQGFRHTIITVISLVEHLLGLIIEGHFPF